MGSSDKPFVLRGGNTEQDALHNRIAAIERIRYISGVDLRTKSSTYLMLFDLEMYQRWYKDYPPDHRIDEEWCQRAADVIKSMEKDREQYKMAGVNIEKRVRAEFLNHQTFLNVKKIEEKQVMGSSGKVKWRSIICLMGNLKQLIRGRRK